MHAMGFTQAMADSCLFHKKTPDGWIIVASEVDDLLVTGTDDAAIEDLRKNLVAEYSITEWDPISSFLGININYKPAPSGMYTHMTLDVEYKIDQLFKQHSILDSMQLYKRGKGEYPIVEDHMSISDSAPITSDIDKYIRDRYASLNGALIYMGITCNCQLPVAVHHHEQRILVDVV